MKTYLITGGAGFIGSNFIGYMINKYGNEIRIINFDKLTYAGNLENLKAVENRENYRFIRGDICNKDAVEEVFRGNNIDYVVNFAAESHVDRSIRNPEVFLRTNVLGTQVLLDAVKKYWLSENSFKYGKRFMQISTDEVYGALGDEGFFTEETPISPRSPYSASKAAGDLIVQSYYHTFGMPVNITRCSNNYGPYQFPEKLIPLIINNCLCGRAIPVYGDGKNVRDWIYVEDHCRGIDVVIEKGAVGRVYNIGGHNERKNIQIIRTIMDVLHKTLPDEDSRRESINEGLISFVEDRKGHDRRYAIDSSRISTELGWTPLTLFEEGIANTINWYIQNNEWLDRVTSGSYQEYYKHMYKANEQVVKE